VKWAGPRQAGGIADGITARFRGLTLLKKTLMVNSGVVLLGAFAGTYLTQVLAARHSGVTLAVLFFSCGAVITILANYLAFWDHFRPLVELSRALDAIRAGREARQAIRGVRASGIGEVVRSVRTLLDLLEDDSMQFSTRLLGSVETERQRIGHELHDDTSQILAAALLSLGMVDRQLPLESQSARESLATARSLIQRSLDQLKVVIYDLRPAMLDDLGLAAALRWYVKARVETSGVVVDSRIEEEPGLARLNPHLEIALYRVAQEALANAVRHSSARRIELGLETKPGFAALTVFDDGKGFDLEQERGRGLGLLSMRERVTRLGGQFNIVTEPGLGTRVYAVVPLGDAATNGGVSS
jgi:two-component system, NarL family, sensor histidine kinase UhpB